MTEDTDIFEAVSDQIQAHGMGVVKVSDGHVFMFTTLILKALLDKSLEHADGKAVVFVKDNVPA